MNERLPGFGYYIQESNGSCSFCSMRRGEDYLTSIKMSSRYRFRDIGIMFAYCGFNLLLLSALYYLFRVFKWRREKAPRKSEKEEHVSPVVEWGEDAKSRTQMPKTSEMVQETRPMEPSGLAH